MRDDLIDICKEELLQLLQKQANMSSDAVQKQVKMDRRNNTVSNEEM